MLAGYFLILFAVLLGQRLVLGLLFRQKRIGLDLNKHLISSIFRQNGFCPDVDIGILEQLETVLLSVGKRPEQ